jgi:SH3-like domain-containing protein
MFSRSPSHYSLFSIFIGAFLLVGGCSPDKDEAAPKTLPYFVNIQPGKAWGRRGPSYDQPVLWEYKRAGLPMLVIDKTLHWRQVRDPDGVETWMRDFLLSSPSMVMVRSKTPLPLYRAPGDNPVVIAYADPGALLQIGLCQNRRCQVQKGNIRGWAEGAGLWGVDTADRAYP